MKIKLSDLGESFFPRIPQGFEMSMGVRLGRKAVRRQSLFVSSQSVENEPRADVFTYCVHREPRATTNHRLAPESDSLHRFGFNYERYNTCVCPRKRINYNLCAPSGGLDVHTQNL